MGFISAVYTPFPRSNTKHFMFGVGISLGTGDTPMFLALLGHECEALGTVQMAHLPAWGTDTATSFLNIHNEQ